jgi:tetratricopeptide (TPR) repeat protein
VSRTSVPPPVDEAVDALRRAGARSEAREGVREARRYYERALAVVADDDVETRLELQVRRAHALIGLGELAAAAEALRDVDEQASAVRRLDLRCEALIGLANVEIKLGNGEDARRHIDEAEALAGVLGDRTLRVRAAYWAATVAAHSESDYERAIEKLLAALAVAEEDADRLLQIEGHMRLGVVFFNLAELGRADEHLERCLELARDLGSLKEEARATYYSAYLAYQHRGDLDEAERLARQTAQWLERTGDVLFEIQNLRLLVVLALARRDLDEAEELLKRALPLALERVPLFVAEVYRLFVEALIGQDRLEDARELAEFAVRDARASDVWSAHATLASAFVSAASGAADAAARDYAAALDRLVEAQAWIDVIEARVAYARIAGFLGNAAVQADELARARDECDRIVAPGLTWLVESEQNGNRGAKAPAPNVP